MRPTLDPLKNSASLLANVEARLTAARKASAIADPAEGLPAPTLASRANDLRALLGGMALAVEALSSARQGILTIQAELALLPPLVEAAADGSRLADDVAADYQRHLDRIDQIATTTRYNGTGLIDGSDPGLLTTLFNGTSASAAPRLLPELVLTPAGLNLAWGEPDELRLRLAQAEATLADAVAALGQALATVRVRQDFTGHLIATLNSVGAPAPARPTRSPSLAPATLANQAVMRLFP